MRTPSTKAADVVRQWFIVDATDLPLGRLATEVATILMGKHRALYTPHTDTGDGVVVINAGKVKLTGQKLDKKLAYRHSGFPGGIRSETYRSLIERRPDFAIEKAVKGMLPKSSLGRGMLTKLKVYADASHPHAAQQPQPIDLRARFPQQSVQAAAAKAQPAAVGA